LHNKLVFVKSINKEYDSRFAQSGAKIGAALLIREPNQFLVRTGAVMDTQDVTETVQTLTLATQKGIDINFSSVELTLSMDEFSERILEPAMSRLATEIDKTVIDKCYKDVYNMVWTTFGTPPVFADIAAARAKLSKALAPASGRIALLESLSMNKVVDDVKALYHSAPEIKKQYDTGLMGHAMGFKFYESEMVPTHTNGSRVDASCVVDAAIVSGTAIIDITGGNNALTLKAGDILTVDEVFAVNPESKAKYAHLQQFVVTEDIACDASGNAAVKVSPTPITSGVLQNISETVAGSAGEEVVHVAAGGSGGANLVEAQNMAYHHRNAFTFVSADLEMPKGVDFAARKVFDGISLRIVRQFDIVNDKFPCRIDVLFGYKSTRPQWACRMPG
jgi:hypothetical protein